jgi:hypothetical protein
MSKVEVIDWPSLIEQAAESVPVPVVAREDAGRAAESASRPQKLLCGDSSDLYAVKFSNNEHGDGRALVAECAAGLLGAKLGAPVAEVALVEVTPNFLGMNPIELRPGLAATPGIHHGSKWIHDCIGPGGPANVDPNRKRFGALEVLYTWMYCSNDQQFLYHQTSNLVFSVDHSPFLPAGPGGWTVQLLDQARGTVQRDAVLGSLGLTPTDRGEPLAALGALSAPDIALAVATPPTVWGLDNGDRLALAGYLFQRRADVLRVLG